jgi:hypothetical protein
MKSILFLCLLFPAVLLGQDPLSLDFWSGLNLKYKKKNWTLGVESQLRCDLRPTSINKGLINIDADYKWKPNIKIITAFRLSGYSNEYSFLDNRSFAFSNRIQMGVELDLMGLLGKKTSLECDLTSRVQYAISKFEHNELDWRNKITIKYNSRKRFTPVMSTELFYTPNQFYIFREDGVQTIGAITEWRNSLGMNYALTRKSDLGVDLIFRKFITKQSSALVFQVGYSYTFSEAKKKKKK